MICTKERTVALNSCVSVRAEVVDGRAHGQGSETKGFKGGPRLGRGDVDQVPADSLDAGLVAAESQQLQSCDGRTANLGMLSTTRGMTVRIMM